MKVCVLIPTYQNPDTVGRVAAAALRHARDVLVIDDGSDPPVAPLPGCTLLRRPANGGKGAALKDGFAWARDHGFDHAVTLDADLQHDADDIPRLLARIHADAPTFVIGQPVFDASAPAVRRAARLVSVFWVMVETWGRKIGDPLCGFRVYPVAAALATGTRANAMDFEPEIAVRLVWAGVPVEHVATRVSYPPGGVSHFRAFTDTVLISLAHARLCIEGLGQLLRRVFRG